MPLGKMSKALAKKIEARTESTQEIQHTGNTFGERHYVLIVKAKRGELWNCGRLKEATKPNITPLFELTERLNVAFEDHVKNVCQSLAAEWGVLPHFVDVRYIGSNLDPSGTSVTELFSAARSQGLQSVPVTSLFFSPKFQGAISAIVQEDGRGLMLRMNVEDFTDPEGLEATINGLLATIDVDVSQVDLLIDYGHRKTEAEVIQLSGLHLALLPHLNLWRTLTIASASFPESISAMAMNTWHSQLRVEWLAWLAVRTQRSARQLRVPTFADYGVRGISTGKAVQNTPAPNLRYTSNQICLIRRGPKNQQQMRQIAQQLVARAEFMGADFSFGDEQIASRANDGSVNDGAAEHWILWCMNHHAEFVTQQLSNLP